MNDTCRKLELVEVIQFMNEFRSYITKDEANEKETERKGGGGRKGHCYNCTAFT